MSERRNGYYPAGGGENLVAPSLSITPGELLFSENYEPDPMGRYRRIDGIERFDGHPKPSKAAYWVLNFDAGVAAISEGDIVTGLTSGATGEALIDAVVTSGSYGTNDAVGYLVLTDVAGTFQNDEALQVSAATKVIADGIANLAGASNDTDDATWYQDAVETARARIGTVPGSGNMRGVWMYNGSVYAFRDNAGATACVMHKSTPTGWVAQDLGAGLAFTLGTSEPLIGETLTGGTSGATGVVGAIDLASGDWATNDAAGTIWLSGVTGTFQSEVATSTSGSLTASGAQTANALPVGGRYEFVNENFTGAVSGLKMYGVNGVTKAFEWDGTQFAFLTTGNATDTPTHVVAHRSHLFLTFGASVQHSELGNPRGFTVGGGAAEIAIGENVTGMISLPGGVLGIFSREASKLLYGSSSSDWELKPHSSTSGGIEWTLQRLVGAPLVLDASGIMSTSASPDFGDFNTVPVSDKIRPLIDLLRPSVTASVIHRRKGHYRLFFADGTAITLGLNREGFTGFLRQRFPVPVLVVCNGTESDGTESVYFGSDDGYVYQMDAGTSFDGAAIEGYLRFAFNHTGSPDRKKRFFKIDLELDAPTTTTINATPDFNYSNDEVPVGQTGQLQSGGGYWGDAVWSEFVWGNPAVAVGTIRILGVGLNMGLSLYSSGIYDAPHTVQGYQLQFAVHGQRR